VFYQEEKGKENTSGTRSREKIQSPENGKNQNAQKEDLTREKTGTINGGGIRVKKAAWGGREGRKMEKTKAETASKKGCCQRADQVKEWESGSEKKPRERDGNKKEFKGLKKWSRFEASRGASVRWEKCWRGWTKTKKGGKMPEGEKEKLFASEGNEWKT